jgi:NAD(P)-dependent dehydrogenase (short-subunit alcohol dehydrogenase family)
MTGEGGGGADKRVCLITGSRGRLGLAFCRAYASRYAIVGVHRSDHATTIPTQHSRVVDPLAPDSPLSDNDHRIFEIRADIRDKSEQARVVDLALARFGRIDLVVSTAVRWEVGALLQNERVLDEARDTFLLNAIAPVQLAIQVGKAFWRHRAAENRKLSRNVVNLSSSSTVRHFPNHGQSVYTASKAALNAFTFDLAAEFESIGVRVNAVAPARFGRGVSVERVAEVVKELDDGAMNGKIAYLDDKGLKLLAFGQKP